MTPTTPALIERDLEALRNFYAARPHELPTAAEIEKVARHHLLPQLIGLGWLVPEPIGRWSTGFRPAGDLAAALWRTA